MVTIKYYPHAVNGDAYIYTVNRLADFLRQPQFDREDLVNMRFFNGDILGNEIDTEDGSFLNICDGEITVVDGRTFPEGSVAAVVVISFVAAAVITAVLMPKPSIPETPSSGSRKQPSSTNSLSESQNAPRVNQRIDDIFGTVHKHTPPLWQAPYRIGVNDREAEVMLLCVGRGKYDIDVDRIYDGDTRYRDIPGAVANVYEPGSNPNNGIPSISTGGIIDEPVGIYRQSNDLNPVELLPPNEAFLGSSSEWFVNQSDIYEPAFYDIPYFEGQEFDGYVYSIRDGSLLTLDLRNYSVKVEDIGLDGNLDGELVKNGSSLVGLLKDSGTFDYYLFVYNMSGEYVVKNEFLTNSSSSFGDIDLVNGEILISLQDFQSSTPSEYYIVDNVTYNITIYYQTYSNDVSFTGRSYNNKVYFLDYDNSSPSIFSVDLSSGFTTTHPIQFPNKDYVEIKSASFNSNYISLLLNVQDDAFTDGDLFLVSFNYKVVNFENNIVVSNSSTLSANHMLKPDGSYTSILTYSTDNTGDTWVTKINDINLGLVSVNYDFTYRPRMVYDTFNNKYVLSQRNNIVVIDHNGSLVSQRGLPEFTYFSEAYISYNNDIITSSQGKLVRIPTDQKITSFKLNNGFFNNIYWDSGSITSNEGIDLTSEFRSGDNIIIENAEVISESFTRTIYRRPDEPTEIETFNTKEISGSYVIDSIDFDTITVKGVTEKVVPSSPVIKKCFKTSINGGEKTFDERVAGKIWYTDSQLEQNSRIQILNYNRLPDVGDLSDLSVGPIKIEEGAEQVILNFTSKNGYFNLKENKEKRLRGEVQITIKELDSQGNLTGRETVRVVPYSSNETNIRYSVFRTFRFDLPYYNCSVMCKRLTNRDKSDKTSNVDKIEWSTMYTFRSVDQYIDFGDVTLMHCMTINNPQSRSVKKRKTNLDVTRKITQYLGNGQFGTPELYATDQFDQILIHTALDPYNGRLTLDQIAADEILMLGDQVRQYFGSSDMAKFGYDFDDDQISYEDMFSLICNAVNCYPYVQSGVYNAFFDRPQTASTLQITHRNKLPDSETREDVFERKYDGVELTYRDNETGVNETIYIPNNRTSTRPERIEAPGVTTELQAYRRALREYNRQRYQTVNTEFQVDEFGRMIVPGQRIDSPDGTRFVRHAGNTDGYRVYDGEVVEVNGLVVELSEPVQFVDGEDHYIQFTRDNGDNSELIRCTPGDDDFTIVMTYAPLHPLYDGYTRDKTKFTFCSEQARESIALIPQTIEFKLDEGKETNTVSFINYDARYYEGDHDEPV